MLFHSGLISFFFSFTDATVAPFFLKDYEAVNILLFHIFEFFFVSLHTLNMSPAATLYVVFVHINQQMQELCPNNCEILVR